MGDLISRNVLIEVIKNIQDHVREVNQKTVPVDAREIFTLFTGMVETQLSVDAVPVVHGEWLDDHGSDVCSVCGFSCSDTYYLGKGNFCPNCGADMRKKVK